MASSPRCDPLPISTLLRSPPETLIGSPRSASAAPHVRLLKRFRKDEELPAAGCRELGAGRWFYDSSEHEDAHLAQVHDNVDHTTGVFSVGASVPSLPSGTYSFSPASTGRRNLDFRSATAIGTVYCYEITVPRTQLVLLQLSTATRLRMEGKPGSSCGTEDTWSLSAGAVEFSR